MEKFLWSLGGVIIAAIVVHVFAHILGVPPDSIVGWVALGIASNTSTELDNL